MPGAMTIKETAEALDYGADIIKWFPGDLFRPAMIRAIRGPIPHAKIMPTGGVDPDNVDQWIRAVAVAVGAGSSLTAPAKQGDYISVTQRARDFVEKVRQARKGGAS